MKTFFREILITAILAVVIFLGAQITVQTFIVVMTSMEPSFHDGQRLLVNKAVFIFSDPERGDVVVFEAPNGRGGDYIKRVIGLPNDTVEIKDKAVYLNGSKLDEPYIMAAPVYTMAELEIPEDHYFVLGDNRNNSDDSHHGWVVPRESMIGKAWISTWPPDNWGLVPDYPLQNQLTSSMLK